jgi:hypothetical protein
MKTLTSQMTSFRLLLCTLALDVTAVFLIFPIERGALAAARANAPAAIILAFLAANFALLFLLFCAMAFNKELLLRGALRIKKRR